MQHRGQKKDKRTSLGRGPSIPQDVELLIATVYLEDTNRAAKEVMAEVHKRLGKGQRRPGWPGISAVQKKITEIRKNQASTGPDRQDRPWSLLALADYDIPPEALPSILKAWAHGEEPILARVWPAPGSSVVSFSASELLPDPGKDTITIREARWIGRLYHVFMGDKALSDGEGLLVQYAKLCALQERAMKLTGPYPDKPEDMRGLRGLWLIDNVVYAWRWRKEHLKAPADSTS